MKKATVIGLSVAAISLGLVLSIGMSSVGSTNPDVNVDIDRPAGDPPPEPEEVKTTPVAAVADIGVFQPGDVFTKSSRVYVFVGKTGFGHEHAIVGKLASGRLLLSGAAPSGQLTFDMTSFSADTSSARKYVGLKGTTDAGTRGKVTANMLGADVLNARTYPKAKFTVTSVVPLKRAARNGLPQYRIDGKFTLHGTTRTVSITATKQTKGSWSHVRGRFSILQTNYGMKPFKKAFGAVGVTDKLTIWGDLWVANKRLKINRAQ